MTKFLKDFSELYDYLVTLSSVLQARGASDLAKEAERASRFAVGLKIGQSTEFVGESKIALRRIRTDGNNILNDKEQQEIDDILRQLTSSLNRWPIKPPG
jgi:hypothetical protein